MWKKYNIKKKKRNINIKIKNIKNRKNEKGRKHQKNIQNYQAETRNKIIKIQTNNRKK